MFQCTPWKKLGHPEQFAGLNCLIPVPTEALQELRKILEEDVGSYEDHMSWYSQDFCRLADETLSNQVKKILELKAQVLDNVLAILWRKRGR